MTARRPTAPAHSPYRGPAANAIYNLLFCDDPEAFRARPGTAPAPWQRLLFADPPDAAALRVVADSRAEEGRIRYLAFARLREAGVAVPPKILLGVVAEVGLGAGLDVLAAYAEGGARYINHTGRLAVVEGDASIEPAVRALFAAAAPVVARIGPWEGPRRPPPEEGMLRLSFLVSDGLYFGEGPTSQLQQDAMAGPVFQAATQLLVKVIERGSSAQ